MSPDCRRQPHLSLLMNPLNNLLIIILTRFLKGPLRSLLRNPFRSFITSPRKSVLILSLSSLQRSLLRIAKCLPIASGSHIVWPNVSRLPAAATFESSNESAK